MSSNKTIHSILRRPIVTEKTTILKEDNNQVAFQVRKDANKIEIREAVEKMLGVKVTGVNTLINRGKSRRMGRNVGKASNWKKAIVTLEAGSEIEFFEALENLDELEEAVEQEQA